MPEKVTVFPSTLLIAKLPTGVSIVFSFRSMCAAPGATVAVMLSGLLCMVPAQTRSTTCAREGDAIATKIESITIAARIDAPSAIHARSLHEIVYAPQDHACIGTDE